MRPNPQLRRLASCIATAPTPAARCAPPTSAPTSAFPAGCTACATTAALLFIDLRDHYGLTQLVADPDTPGLQDRRDGARRVGDPRRRRGARRAPEDRQRQPADRRDRGLRAARSRCCRRPRNCRCRCSASRTIPEDMRLQVPLPRPAPRDAAQEHRAAHRRSSPRCAGAWREAGFTEFPTPILTASSPGGRARLPGAVAASIRASSTRCRRRRSSTSS